MIEKFNQTRPENQTKPNNQIKRDQFIKRFKNFEKAIKIKEKKIAKIRRVRNAHKNNFEKINVKIKLLIINKKTIKKIIVELKKKLKHAKSFLFLNSD